MEYQKSDNHSDSIYNNFRSYGTCNLSEMSDLDITSLYGGRYNLLKHLRIGGMSTIYLAKDNEKNCMCVVKEMSHYYTSSEEQELAVYMFEVEAYMMLSLNHPNIPAINNYFIENDNYYLVMEYIEGINLGERLNEMGNTGFSEKEVIQWAIQICDILSYLHSFTPPIIHRDIKPDNFIQKDDGKIIIIDFGIATLFEPGSENPLIGTPGYIPPEQYEGIIDVKGDIYSLGVSLHQFLTGNDPSEGIPFELSPLREIKPELSEVLESIINRSVEMDMDKRFSSALEMKEELLKLV